jgi:MFS family permease
MQERSTGQDHNNGAAGIVAACLVGNFVSATPMVNATFGTFLIPISTEFGWHRSQVALVLTIVAVIGVLAYPVVGRLSDRIGVRNIVLAGNLLFAASVAALSLTGADIWSFYALFLLVGFMAALPSTVLLSKVVASWFVAKRGMMMGLTAGVGNGLGATLMPIVAGALVAGFGWRGAYMGLGLLIAVIGFPVLWFLLRDRPAVPAAATDVPAQLEGVSLAEAARTPAFAVMLAAIGLGAGSLTAVFSHVVPILLDRGIGIGVATAAIVAFALTCMVWQVVMGWMLDRVSDPRIAAPFFLVPIAGLALLMHADGSVAFCFGGMLLGIALGTEYGLLPYWVPRYFGRRAYGAIYGSMAPLC